ncbi:MAG TPA: FAD-dependent oxidoreductase, partial [Candidatus Dormibacteraeota bacterium]
MSSVAGSRTLALERLQGEVFDLLVVGAGIIGARVALEAARTGARVALVDAGDFGWATSSASSKLVHGGLRYLQMRDYSLVRESHRERQALVERVAPHLVRPLRFVLPVYRGGPHSVPTVAAGMLTYATLSGFRHAGTRMVGAEGARHLVPALKTEGLLAAGIFEDAQTHDSRLVLATVKAAARAGAVVVNHLAVTGLETAA